MGRKLLFPASDKVFLSVAKDEYLRTFFNGDGRIRMDIVHGERQGFRQSSAETGKQRQVSSDGEALRIVRLDIPELRQGWRNGL